MNVSLTSHNSRTLRNLVFWGTENPRAFKNPELKNEEATVQGPGHTWCGSSYSFDLDTLKELVIIKCCAFSSSQKLDNYDIILLHRRLELASHYTPHSSSIWRKFSKFKYWNIGSSVLASKVTLLTLSILFPLGVHKWWSLLEFCSKPVQLEWIVSTAIKTVSKEILNIHLDTFRKSISCFYYRVGGHIEL